MSNFAGNGMSKRKRCFGFILLLILLMSFPAYGQSSDEYRDPTALELGELGARATNLADSTYFVSVLQRLCTTHQSRVMGTEGNTAATDFIADEYERLGLTGIVRQTVHTPRPRQHYAYALLPLEAGGYDTVALHSYYPNFARTNTLLPEGLSGHLVYSELGDVREFNGQDMDGGILLAEMTIAERWRSAVQLGCRAAIFIQPEDSLGRQIMPAYSTSINFPRFFVDRAEGLRLHRWMQNNPDGRITLKARQPWELVSGDNVFGFVEGTDPVLRNEMVIIAAPFDGESIVPDRAPGAEAALSAASQLELARILTQNRPKRSVLFAAMNGHDSGTLIGGRMFTLALKQSYPEALRQIIEFLRRDIRLISDRQLADKFPEYRDQAISLEDSLNAIISGELAAAEQVWEELQNARRAYREQASPTLERNGQQLMDARERLAPVMTDAAERFSPVFTQACDRVVPVIERFGELHRIFIDSLETDRSRLLPIVAEDQDSLLTTVTARLAAARLTDIRKAMAKVSRIGAGDHHANLSALRNQLSLIEPVLGRNLALLVDLSVTSGNSSVGVFYKGKLYNQAPELELKREYGNLGKRFAQYADHMVIIHDINSLRAVPHDSLEALILAKIDRIVQRRNEYRNVVHLLDRDVELVHTYSIHHSIFNATAWLLGLIIAAVALVMIFRISRKTDDEDSDEEAEPNRAPAFLWIVVVLGVVLTGYSLIAGFDWKNTNRRHHGLDELIWNHTDLLVQAQNIPREDKTKIRLAAERHISYVDLVEAPEFFADNIIKALPATIQKLQNDSANMALQLGILERVEHLAGISPALLEQPQLDSINTFVRFLGMAADRRFVDCVAGTKTKSWGNFIPGRRFFHSEIATLSGLPAVALSTLDDVGGYINTPMDQYENLSLGNAFTQVRTITGLMTQVLQDPTLPDDLLLEDFYAQAHGLVLFDDRQASVTADVPVENALIIADRLNTEFYALTDGRGRFSMYGLPLDGHGYGPQGEQWVHVYKMSPDSGHVVYAVDLGNDQYKFAPTIGQKVMDWTTVVFKAVSVSITDVMDQRYFQYLPKADVYDARTDALPAHYFVHVAWGDNTAFVEPNIDVKMIFKQGLLGIRSMLTGVPDSIRYPEHRQGLGFAISGAETLLVHTSYQAARDMWELNEARLKTLIRHGIIDDETRQVHERASVHLKQSQIARYGLEPDSIRRPLQSVLAALERRDTGAAQEYLRQAADNTGSSATSPEYDVVRATLTASSALLAGSDFSAVRNEVLAAREAHARGDSSETAAHIATATMLIRQNPHHPVRASLFAVSDALVHQLPDAVDVHLGRALAALEGEKHELVATDIRGLLNGRQYDTYLTEARTALALESRVLPSILDTANGALKGVLFYMTLLLPFAFFLERLIIGAKDIRSQAIWFFGIFIASFVVVEQIHPAFDITTAPPMVLLAFTVFALSLFVTSIIISKFTAQMQQIRKEKQGYLSADVGRVSAMLTAFMLGVSNMRKRKVRTSLTCLTLILLTFTVLSFTSVKEYLRVNRLELSQEEPVYDGVLIRDRYWNNWPLAMLPNLRNEFGNQYIVVGRSWREAFTHGADHFFTLQSESGREYTLMGFVGMEPEEDQVTGIFRKAGVAGRWFREDDLYSLVIPQTAADALGIRREQVTGDVETAPKVIIEGRWFSVVGILDDETLRGIVDLDGEQLTSVNWQLTQQKRVGREQQLVSGQTQSMGENDSYVHLVPAQCMFVPLRATHGGRVSTAIRTASPQEAEALVDQIINKWALEIYVGEHTGTYYYSAVGLASLGGLKDVLVPIIIAALIVLNTMLGAVYERTREIGIFTAVGLAPSHVAMLFMAEAAVYAVLGAVAGYLMGQTVGQVVYKTGLLGGITLNYSSLSAIASSVIVMITVILSTVYPSRKASQISVPDIARTWRLPDPSGDEWYFALPFTIMDEELEGLNAFLASYYDAHREESSSEFYIDKVDFWVEQGKFMLETMAWLAPYDLGVSQLVTIITTPIPEEQGLYAMSMLVTRESGDISSWNRVNRRFVNFLRKQFLIWRTLTPEERAMFVQKGKKMFTVNGERAANAELKTIEIE